MKKYLYKPIHLRDELIAIFIAITILILGAFYDQKFSEIVFVNHDGLGKWFGIIMSGFAEFPSYLVFFLAGFVLIVTSLNSKKIRKIFSFIFGLLIMLGAFYLQYSTLYNIAEFEDTIKYEIFIIAVSSFITLAIDVCLIFFIYFYLIRNPDKNEKAFRLAILLIAIMGVELIFQQTFKYLASRPRPYYVYDVDNGDAFKNFYEWNPFYAFEGGDAFKSFPSGHTATASLMIFYLPLIINFFIDFKKKPWLNILLFYVGLTYALISALSRTYAGAHFLSDVAAGLLLSLITSYLTIIVTRLIYKKIDKSDYFSN